MTLFYSQWLVLDRIKVLEHSMLQNLGLQNLRRAVIVAGFFALGAFGFPIIPLTAPVRWLLLLAWLIFMFRVVRVFLNVMSLARQGKALSSGSVAEESRRVLHALRVQYYGTVVSQVTSFVQVLCSNCAGNLMWPVRVPKTT